MNATVILMILSSFVGLLKKLVGTQWESVIQNGLAALATLLTNWTKGAPANDIALSLGVLQSILIVLQKNTSMDPQLLPQIGEAVKVIEAAIKGYEDAENGADPSLAPVPDPVP